MDVKYRRITPEPSVSKKQKKKKNVNKNAVLSQKSGLNYAYISRKPKKILEVKQTDNQRVERN